MKILIGSTNPSKIKRFEEFLSDCNAEFCTPWDLGITEGPGEEGQTPLENAVIKAGYYGRYSDLVICNDSGLYFDELRLDDIRQPGLHIRTPQGMPRLGDEEMISYYSALIYSLGGSVTAFYLDGYAVSRHGMIYSFVESIQTAKKDAFRMVAQPSGRRHPGWPLDSLSVGRNTGRYFTDGGNDRYEATDAYSKRARARVTGFLKESLGIA